MAPRKKMGYNGSLHRRLHSQTEKPLPHFFKIILPSTLKDKKLRIPSKFVKRFSEEISDIAEVVCPKGHAWKIGLSKEQNNIWFDNGWQKFLEHHSIASGYLLLFQHRGCSNFRVFIFDSAGCGVQYQCTGPSTGVKEIDHGENCSTRKADEIGDEGFGERMNPQYFSALKSGVLDENASKGESSKEYNPTSEKHVKEEYLEITELDDTDESRRRKSLKENRMSSPYGSLFTETKAKESESRSNLNLAENECEVTEIVARGFAKASEESKRAIHAARMFKPKNPSFMVMLRHYNFYNHFLYVPLEFAKKHMTGPHQYIKLQVSDGREWPVHVNRNKQYLTLSKGWHEFSRENNLEEGDVCVFELINSKSFVLEVSIFHKIDHNDPSN